MVQRCANRTNALGRFALRLDSVGSFYWGLAGPPNVNLVSAVFGKSPFSRMVYTLAGLSGANLLSTAVPES